MKAKTKKILYWVFTILFAAFMLFSAEQELMQTQSAQDVMTQLGYPIYVNYIIGIAKVLGALAILQWRFRTIKEWAYAGFTIDIVGAALSNGFVEGIGTALFTLVFLVPMALSYWLWKQTDTKA